MLLLSWHASILKDLANDLTFIHSGKTESVIPDFIATNILCIIALAKASQCYSEKQELKLERVEKSTWFTLPGRLKS